VTLNRGHKFFSPPESTEILFCLLPASETKQVKMEGSAINGHGSVPSSAKVALVKLMHPQKKEQLVHCANQLHVTTDDAAEVTNSYLPADELFVEDVWDPEYYDEQDSFS
jgi:hypothetical protein